MPTGTLGSNSRSAQFYQASGESTPQATLPEQYISNPAATSPISGHMKTPTDWMSQLPGRDAAVVRRWPRMVGMRYLYARGMTPMPIQALGADGIPRPWVSRAQPNNEGPIRNGGFNDALFQAGYPGFNLGLSFKVPTVSRTGVNQPGWNMRMNGPKVPNPVDRAVARLRRPSGAPKEFG